VGIISAIISLLRAIPSLERLVLKIADGVKEQQARTRKDEKMDRIDNRINAALRVVRHDEAVQRGGSTDGGAGVRGRRKRGPGLDKKGTPSTG